MSDIPTRPELPSALQQSVAQSRKVFVSAMADIRPRLHKFCARMCGSTFDGEDIVQEVLADAFYNLSSLKDATKFESWLFRIAYNKCIDHLRRMKSRAEDPSFTDEHDVPESNVDEESVAIPTDDALVALIGELPPKERAAVLLKEVLDYSLTETAEVIDSTLGGVKSALHRARTKLNAMTVVPQTSSLDVHQKRLFTAYAEVFNKRDWEALSRLVRADARLEIVGEVRGDMRVIGATYHTNYERLPWEWRLSAEEVESRLVIVHWRRTDGSWQVHSAVQLLWDGESVVGIKDYVHVPYLFRDVAWAASVASVAVRAQT
ncbi:MAG: RNA polymerase sigma factor [Gemmatimonas sp.]